MDRLCSMLDIVIVEDEVGLNEPQKQNWHHFVEKIWSLVKEKNLVLKKALIWTKI